MRSCCVVASSTLCLILAGCSSSGTSSTSSETDGGSSTVPGAEGGTLDATTTDSDTGAVTPDATTIAADVATEPDADATGIDATSGTDAGGNPAEAGTAQSDANTPADASSKADSGPATDSGGDAASKPGDGGTLPKITIWLAGDSTVANGETPCPVGWGKEFGALFNSSVTVTNSAVGGTSIRSWLYNPEATADSTGECILPTGADGQPTVQAHWQAMLDGMKPGDYLFIQFGINDGSTCPVHDGVAAFMTSLGVMATAATTRGAQPVFVTPVSSISCKGSTAVPTRGTYATATMQAAAADSVPLIDLETLSVALYNSSAFCPLPNGETDVSDATPGAVGAFFCDDHTHFETSGAMQIAGLVATALQNQGIGLASYLK